jgi:hypothetical protein
MLTSICSSRFATLASVGKSNADYQRDYRERQKPKLTVVKSTWPGWSNPGRAFLFLRSFTPEGHKILHLVAVRS